MAKRLLFISFAIILVASCQSDSHQKPSDSSDSMFSLTGKTMGTSLSIKYSDSIEQDFATNIDSLLIEVNNSMSTYIPNSLISIFNRSDTALRMEVDHHFYSVFKKSKEIYEATKGSFNPAVMPLVNYWGFGSGTQPPENIDSSVVDSLVYICDFSLVDGAMIIKENGDTSYYVRKKDGRVKLDFSAIAKGYGVDALGQLLERKGIDNYMVEIGGEVRCRGRFSDEFWKIGIEDPKNSKIQDRKATKIIELRNESIATSGNYRNVRVIGGKKYAHTINPNSGYPEMGELLSASIIADDCMTADGYATACMVMGKEESIKLLTKENKLKGFLIYSDDNGDIATYTSEGLKEQIIKK